MGWRTQKIMDAVGPGEQREEGCLKIKEAEGRWRMLDVRRGK